MRLRTGRCGVEHLFSVAAGLESALVGERQILDQVRRAWFAARAAGPLDARLDRLFQHAVGAGRKVRRETGITGAAASLAETAARMVAASLDVAVPPVAIVGAGAVARSTALALAKHGARHFVVVSRAPESREALARSLGAAGVRCDTRPWSELAAAIGDSGVIICATAAPGHVLETGCLTGAGPLTVVDLASPRDVNPAVGRVPGVRLIDLDSLWREISRSRRVPEAEELRARAMVVRMTDAFMRWLAERDAVPAIAALRAAGRSDQRGHARALHERTLALKNSVRERAAAPREAPGRPRRQAGPAC